MQIDENILWVTCIYYADTRVPGKKKIEMC